VDTIMLAVSTLMLNWFSYFWIPYFH
jgi:hypothetical protein